MKTIPVLTLLVSIIFSTERGTNAQSSVAVTTQSCCQTQVVTLTATYSGGLSTATYSLTTNQIVIFNYVTNTVSITLSNGKNIQPPAAGVPFTGLTSVSLYNPISSSTYYTLFKVLTPSTNTITYVPQNSVVIPSSATGNVQIILQSSSDLVNWVPSQPGTYGSTYTNRFFRVIAVAQ